MQCDHRGTIWAIDVPDCPNGPCPCGYECTRCGAQWDQDPRPGMVPEPSGAVPAADR